MPAPETADSVYDAALDKLASATNVLIVAGDPADRTAALVSPLVNRTVNAGNWTKANGDVDGRKITLAAATGLTVDNGGTPSQYVAIDATEILKRWQVGAGSPDLTQGSTADMPALKHEIGDPTNV